MKLIVKKRGKPLKLYALEALYRRLPNHHPVKEKVAIDLMKEKAGLLGEKEVEFALRFLHEKTYSIMHDVRLEDHHGAFQLDTLLLTTKFGLILEVKNWHGTVIFGENGQVTRIGDDGMEEGFSNPIAQAQLQQYRLQNWLQTRNISGFPIYYVVVISFPSTIVKAYSEQVPIPPTIIHANQLLQKTRQLEQLHQQKALTSSQLHLLSRQIIRAHTPVNVNVLEKYQINATELIRGVICPVCSHTPMMRDHHMWTCKTCHHQSRDAHLAAFNDYFLLINRYVTNQQMRTFLKIDSPHVMKYLLKKAQFNTHGKTKSRKYELRITPIQRSGSTKNSGI